MLGERRWNQEKPFSSAKRTEARTLPSKPQTHGHTQITRNGLNGNVRDSK